MGHYGDPMRISFTDHAVDQFINRVRPELNWTQAQELLYSTRVSKRVASGVKTRRGQTVVALEDLDCAAIVELEHGEYIAITILSMAMIAEKPLPEAEIDT